MALKLNTYAKHIGNTNVATSGRERIILRMIFWSIGALAIIYILLLGYMVRNILARRSLEVSARTLSKEVGDLELNFLSLSAKVDLPLAYSMGFKEAKATFAVRKAHSSLSLNPPPLPSIPIENIKLPQNEL